MQIRKKLRVFNDRLFVSNHSGGGGAGVHRGLMEGGQQWGGGQQRGAGVREIGGGGSTVGVSSTSKNRPSQHKYKSPKQSELKQS